MYSSLITLFTIFTLTSSRICIKSLVRITQEGNIHLWRFVLLLAIGSLLGPQLSSGIGLINLIDREVGGVNVGCQPWLEWSSDPTKAVKIDPLEEYMVFDLVCTSTSETILRVTDQAGIGVSKSHK